MTGHWQRPSAHVPPLEHGGKHGRPEVYKKHSIQTNVPPLEHGGKHGRPSKTSYIVHVACHVTGTYHLVIFQHCIMNEHSVHKVDYNVAMGCIESASQTSWTEF